MNENDIYVACALMTGHMKPAYTRQAVMEYHGQVVRVLIIRRWWKFYRVMIAVEHRFYRLKWIRKKRLWYYEQIEPERWNDRRPWKQRP